jgi:hypothetical protein
MEKETTSRKRSITDTFDSVNVIKKFITKT